MKKILLLIFLGMNFLIADICTVDKISTSAVALKYNYGYGKTLENYTIPLNKIIFISEIKNEFFISTESIKCFITKEDYELINKNMLSD